MDAGGDISGTCPLSFGRTKKNETCLDWKCFENGKNEIHKKKGLFGEALILTTSHLVVLVIIL